MVVVRENIVLGCDSGRPMSAWLGRVCRTFAIAAIAGRCWGRDVWTYVCRAAATRAMARSTSRCVPGTRSRIEL